MLERGKSAPDKHTFPAVPTDACNPRGIVNKGRQYFETMSEIMALNLHCNGAYGCIIDLVARAGYITKANEIGDKYADETRCSDLEKST
ncbi:unnamed protein product [Brassica oleracea]